MAELRQPLLTTAGEILQRGRARSPADADWLAALVATAVEPSARAAACRALSWLRAPHPALAAALYDPDAEVRGAALRALVVTRDAAPALRVELAARFDPAGSVRVLAVRALGLLGVVRAVVTVRGALTRDLEPAVRAEAALAARRLEDPLALPGLVAALRDSSGAVRLHAARAVEHLARALGGGLGAAALFERLCDDPVAETRAAALGALARLAPGESTTARLRQALHHDPHEGVRTVAAGLLGA